jgi:hypothetical protein
MIEGLRAKGFGRIVVELGSHSAGSAAGIIDLATDLARALNIEITALFVEEEQLFDLVGLPIGAAVHPGAREGVARPDHVLIQETLARQARLCHLALARKAKESDLRWSFESRRGDPLNLVQAIAGPGDLVILSGSIASVTMRSGVVAAQQALAKAAAVIVAFPHRPQPRGTIVVIDQHGLAAGLEELAAGLASSLREKLSVFQLHVRTAAKASGGALEGEANLAAAKAALRLLKPRLLISSLVGSAADEDLRRLSSLVRAAQSPLLLVRNHDNSSAGSHT